MTAPQNNSPQARQDAAPAPSPKDKLISALLHAEDPDKARHYRWRDLAFGDGQWLCRQIPVVLLVVLGVVIYVSNRYQAQNDTIELVRLQGELKDVKYRVLTRSSELTLITRQSELEKRLRTMGDTTLTTAGGAPFVITESEQEE